MMKRLFSKGRSERSENHSKLWSVTCALLIAAFLVAAAPGANAQRLRRRPRPAAPITSGKNLPNIYVDGDRVQVLETNRGGEPGKVKIKLDADGTWWKMLKVNDDNLIEQQDGAYVGDKDTIVINSSDLGETFNLEFWKAKLFGVHTYIKTETYRTEDFEGRVVRFVWKEGLPDTDPAEGRRLPPINETVSIEGKNVTIRSAEGGTAGYATIVFNTNLDWWTAIKVFDRFGNAKLIERESARYRPGDQKLLIPINDLSSDIRIEFWTAKFLGVHTHMATKGLSRDQFKGRTVTINWYK
ncbi:MAG: hypothetical protein L0229_25940 [Blastocatellia bacterium]|nr:hypothetical protein [Blastocatellia bacterium]